MSAPYVPPCRCELSDDHEGMHLPSCPHFDPAHDPAADAGRALTDALSRKAPRDEVLFFPQSARLLVDGKLVGPLRDVVITMRRSG